MYQPRFRYTDRMVKLLISIEKSKAIVDMLPLPLNLEQELRSSAKVKIAHFSTRIEGNPLNLAEASQAIKKHRDREGSKAEQEVRNYWEALAFLSKSKVLRIKVSENFIKRLHSIIEVRSSGRRQKESEYRGATPPGVLFAVYDSDTREPDYIPPEACEVPKLMKEYVEWLNSSAAEAIPVPVKAAAAAYQLLTIHPFEDGNGRTARALATFILSGNGYDLKGFNSMEEYYVADLKGYYKNLQMGLPPLYYDGRDNPEDLAPWIEYFLSIMENAAQRVVYLIKQYTERKINPKVNSLEPKEKKLLQLMLTKPENITPKEIAEEFNVHPRTIINWSGDWLKKGLIKPASGEKRIRSYKVGDAFSEITKEDLY